MHQCIIFKETPSRKVGTGEKRKWGTATELTWAKVLIKGHVLFGLNSFIQKLITYNENICDGSFPCCLKSHILSWPIELTVRISVVRRHVTAWRVLLSALSVENKKYTHVISFLKKFWTMHDWENITIKRSDDIKHNFLQVPAVVASSWFTIFLEFLAGSPSIDG